MATANKGTLLYGNMENDKSDAGAASQFIEKLLMAVHVIHKILDLGAVDQFLALEYAAQQQADDDQHDGDFDQGKTTLTFGICHHYSLL
jgi:hypothetical protein